MDHKEGKQKENTYKEISKKKHKKNRISGHSIMCNYNYELNYQHS